MINLLVVVQRQPVRTWTSLVERSLYHSEKMHNFVKRSKGELMLLTSVADVKYFLEQKKKNKKIIRMPNRAKEIILPFFIRPHYQTNISLLSRQRWEKS